MPTQTAAKLAFSVQPSNTTAGAAIGPAVEVVIQDAFGQALGGATDTVTVALGGNPAAGTLSGTATVAAVNGVATFHTLSIDKAGAGYTLVASSGALNATSTPFGVAPGAAAALAFLVQPGTTEGVLPVTPAVQVAIQDVFANTVTTSTNAVTVALGTNPGGGALLGTTTANAVDGIAVFRDLRIDRPGVGYTLAARSGTLLGAGSVPFDVRLTFTAVSAGEFYTCGVTTAHAVYCWGQNADGELGDSTATGPQRCRGNYPCSTTPVPVSGGLAFATLSAGRSHSCGTTPGGAAYCWGFNGAGQLGDGTKATRTSPVAVVSGLTFATVSAGDKHTCGVTTGGVAYCWGSNANGELGDGTTIDEMTPVAVAGGLTFTTVGAGSVHTCGVTTTGAAYCWGSNANGELGDGTTTDRTSPVAVVGSLTFTTVSAVGAHTCGVTEPGATAFCWGGNGYGELGDGTTTERTTPSAVYSAIVAFAAVSAGFDYSCGVRTGGAAYCWGFGLNGELGSGTTASWTRPVAVVGGFTFATVSAGFYHSCGVATGGAVLCWGYNYGGELGDGTTSTSLVPVRVVQ